MDEKETYSRCQKPLPEGAADGLCPECLLQASPPMEGAGSTRTALWPWAIAIAAVALLIPMGLAAGWLLLRYQTLKVAPSASPGQQDLRPGAFEEVSWNPGFEAGLEPWGWPGGWWTISTTTDSPHSGQQAAMAWDRTDSWQGVGQSLLGRIEPGRVYPCSAWVRIENGPPRTDPHRLVAAGLNGMLKASGWDAAGVLPQSRADEIKRLSKARETPAEERGVLGLKRDDALSTHYANVVIHQGHAYGFHGHATEGGGPNLRCVELASGKVVWQQPETGSGTLIRAGENLFILTDRGQLQLAKASPAEFKVKCRAQVVTPLTRSYPAIADGYVFVKGPRKLVCVDLRAESGLGKP